MTPVTLRRLTKTFGSTVAVDAIDLDVTAGDLFFLLGPSGCGKTTLLRMLAGFIEPTAGEIHFGEREVTHVAPNGRDTGMVFQGYALWPHMSVAQNVAFGLTVGSRKSRYNANQRKDKVDRALAATHISAYADRKPNELSGGQQQRVALARALVIEPALMLLDEPLSNLDAKLRLDMRVQIREICKQAGITAVYVTHDQKEALSMADSVAVLREGRIMQVGPPRQLYERPGNRFVADFLGETNFVPAQVKHKAHDRVVLETAAGMLESTVFPADLPLSGNVTCSIRPEVIQIRTKQDAVQKVPNGFTAQPTQSIYLGEMAQYTLKVNDQLQLKAFELNPRPMDDTHRALQLTIDPSDVVILHD